MAEEFVARAVEMGNLRLTRCGSVYGTLYSSYS